ncbi:MAG: dihydrofolate reductase [Prevotella sp.]|nr:dihydrofolate reductase [Prevotella sp.]
MKRFKKIVAIEPVSMLPPAEKKLHDYAGEVVMYGDIPADDDEIVRRIGDADAVLLSYTSTITKEIMARCAGVRYIGMCCSLYSPESANVDILYAREHGITVTGIRDYGDEGVVEYVVSELVRCLHGFGQKPWFGEPSEITGLKVGVVGLGKSGGMIADAMSFFGAEIAYFARGEKAAAEAKGYRFMPLGDLLDHSDVVFCCLNKNTVLLHDAEFERLGSHKILFNTGLSPAWDEESFGRWIAGDNLCFCDTEGALGGKRFVNHPNVRCMGVSTGRSRQAFVRLGDKVLANIESFLA